MRKTTPGRARSLYVHVPYCHTICGYCDFYSQVLDRDAVGALVDALLSDLARQRERLAAPLDTVFFGGGTPTVLPVAHLARLLAAVAELVDERTEWTIEANPATVTAENAALLAARGVNRVSVGAQSFDASELRVLERIHRVEQVTETLEVLRRAGLARLNLDLIFGVPGQTLRGWEANLERAVGLGVEHLSCYGLTFERGTPLHEQLTSGQVRRVDPEVEARMYERTIELLDACGLGQYEISNFARPGGACRHNLAYWRNEPVAALGPSAAGFDGVTRYRNIPDTAEYVRAVRAGRSAHVECETLPPDRRARETAMLNLRLREGIQRHDFAARFGVDPAVLFAEAIDRHAPAGLLEVDSERIRLTRRGQLVADGVMGDFV
ncbi:MAG: Oxygen-independent coproporphyrinogen-III oxidase-like protein YqeR [Phycisphaerae bacterium]|nr:Oxygen-independent coproporphyrinogen-III oxidase-like protein YqeR [Phycisphaerae bacterium]